MKIRLTNSNINILETKDKRYSVWDTDITGFGMRISPSGTKTYILKYISPTTHKQKNFTIGRHGNITPKTARDEAIRLRAQIISNTDPQTDKIQNRKAMTVSELCDLYLKKSCSHKKESTLKTDVGRINRHIKPLIGNEKVVNITRSDIINFQTDVTKGKSATTEKTKKHGLARVVGGEGTALKARKLLSSMLNFAIDQSIIETNPALRIKLGSDRKSERYLSTEEINKLFEILNLATEKGENIHAISVIKLLIITGCRKGEILSSTWQELNFEKSRLELKDSKTGAKFVQLSSEALAIFTDMPRISKCEYIFPGSSLNKPYQGLQKFWEKIRKRANIEDVRIHDLRHTYATMAASNGLSLPVIGKLLGHKDPSTTQRYAHITKNAEKNAIDEVSEIYKNIQNVDVI